MKRFLTLFIATIALSVYTITNLQSQELQYVVIVHKDNPVESLAKSDISQYMLKGTTTWSHNNMQVMVEPVDLSAEQAIRHRFTQDVMNRSVEMVKLYWDRLFTVKGIAPPPERQTEKEVIDFVGSHPGAIGYVSSTAELTDEVKTVPVK